MDILQLQEEEVGRGIDEAKRPVEIHGVEGVFRRKALREDGLDDVARADVLLCPADHLLERFGRHVGFELDVLAEISVSQAAGA